MAAAAATTASTAACDDGLAALLTETETDTETDAAGSTDALRQRLREKEAELEAKLAALLAKEKEHARDRTELELFRKARRSEREGSMECMVDCPVCKVKSLLLPLRSGGEDSAVAAASAAATGGGGGGGVAASAPPCSHGICGGCLNTMAIRAVLFPPYSGGDAAAGARHDDTVPGGRTLLRQFAFRMHLPDPKPLTCPKCRSPFTYRPWVRVTDSRSRIKPLSIPVPFLRKQVDSDVALTGL